MNNIVKIVISTLIGAGSFSAGLYYATLEFDKTLDNIMGEYTVISEQVDTFVDVSNPETILFYTAELRKLLDDIDFLSTLIQSGQVVDEALDKYLISRTKDLNDMDNRVVALAMDTQALISQLKLDVNTMISDMEVNVNSQLLSSSDKITDELDKVNSQFEDIQKQIKELNKVIDKIKNSKMSKYLK